MMTATRNTILIADDSELQLEYLSEILCDDYDIIEATNGQDAVDKAREYLPDLILLDVIMPEMDGYTATSLLKSAEDTKEIPIIFVTGLCGFDSERKGLSLGAVDYISKPYDPAIVRLRAENHIRIRNQLHVIEMLSTTDQLTGLPNRRSFDSRVEMEWNRAKRDNKPCSILLVDVDDFKVYNDTYGHLNGDEVLRQLAGVLNVVLSRPGDYSARWGGEEFVIMLPETDLDGALIVAEKLRSAVEEMRVNIFDYLETRTTISIGVNTCVSTDNCLIEEFIDEADKALYIAKRTGKNKVCSFRDIKNDVRLR